MSASSKLKVDKLPWTDNQVETLLNLVIVKGLHLKSGIGISELWDELNMDAFAKLSLANFVIVVTGAG